MTTFDDDLLSKEDLDNIDNDNEADEDVNESSSHNEEMKKILNIGKRRGRRAQWEDQHVNDLIETIRENEYFQRKLIFTNNKPQKNKEVYDKAIKEINEKYESKIFFCKTGLLLTLNTFHILLQGRGDINGGGGLY